MTRHCPVRSPDAVGAGEVTLRSSAGNSGWSFGYAAPEVRSVVNAWG